MTAIAYDHESASWRPEAPYFPDGGTMNTEEMSLVRSQVFLAQEEAALRDAAPTLAAEIQRLTAERDQLRGILDEIIRVFNKMLADREPDSEIIGVLDGLLDI